ncbi:leukocyte cell-derived chemotaxin 1-like isoform X1 [Astyanax mexicanus]|uniref:Leukocyte cell-derived chemotaxin 1 n=1 Tax=Astyanax mexicanus TaxID=7994 RepID=A0A8T2LGV9_ASTMX|nr:leukocyte cell-derived chemotaxin 1-like isoform X1 [Astyanax mexicanus]
MSVGRRWFVLCHLNASRTDSRTEMLLVSSQMCPEKWVSSAMEDSSEKNPATSEAPGDVEQALLPVCSAAGLKPLGNSCLWRTGVTVLIIGAALILLGAAGAFHLWKNDGKQQVISLHYSIRINGKPADASMEIDSKNNLEKTRTGSEDGEAVEVHDFKAGITAVWFTGEHKCYIRSQTRDKLRELETLGERDSVTLELDEMLPQKPDEDPVVWVASQEPVKDKQFLSPQILKQCRDLPVYWLHPTHPKTGRKRRQIEVEEFDEREANVKNDTGSPGPGEENLESGSAGSAYNPENPYHRKQDSEVGNMVFDALLDHRGICCSECQHGHTHCERICEPLGGYWPWPYNYRGCRVACRLIMPCRWWAARMLGLV